MKTIEQVNKELDRAIEEKKRQLLAESVGEKISNKLEPHLEAISILLGGITEKDTQSEITKKLDELKETLTNHEVTIEI